MKKLIVDKRQARTIRDEREFTLTRKVLKRGVNNLQEAVNRAYPKGQRFWVAEPVRCIRTEARGLNKAYYSIDPAPLGAPDTCISGYRLKHGLHRHEVEVIGYTTVPAKWLNEDHIEIDIKFKRLGL